MRASHYWTKRSVSEILESLIISTFSLIMLVFVAFHDHLDIRTHTVRYMV